MNFYCLQFSVTICLGLGTKTTWLFDFWFLTESPESTLKRGCDLQ